MTVSSCSAPTEAGAEGRIASAIQLRGRELVWGRRTYIMGVLNVTPDSFSGDGLGRDLGAAVARAEWLVEGGADIVDVGGESTRPGAAAVSVEEELARVVPVVTALRRSLDAPISVDTSKADVAEAALDAGADMVNDVWALGRDPRMADLVVSRGVPVALMHNRSDPALVRRDERLGGHYGPSEYADVVSDVAGELALLARRATAAGIAPERIILDPGLGFGKSPAQNLRLLDQLDRVCQLGYPVLVGPSRKSFIGLTLDLPPDDRVEGTAASVSVAICRGADLVRLHDVTLLSRVVRMTDAIVRHA